MIEVKLEKVNTMLMTMTLEEAMDLLRSIDAHLKAANTRFDDAMYRTGLWRDSVEAQLKAIDEKLQTIETIAQVVGRNAPRRIRDE